MTRDDLKTEYAEKTKPKVIFCNYKDYHKHHHLLAEGYQVITYPLPARNK